MPSRRYDGGRGAGKGGEGKGGLKTRPMRRIEIGEAGHLSIKLQGYRSGRSVALLSNNDLGLSVHGIHLRQPCVVFRGSGTRFLVRQVVFLAVDKEHDVRVLLNGAGFTQI